MAKPTAPLLSFGARGTIAKTAVYSSWRGVPYVRQHVVPANPRTTAQMNNRAVFSWIQAVWKVSVVNFQTVWTAFAMGRPITNRNAFLQKNAVLLEASSNLDNLVFSPGANAGIALSSFTPTGGSGSVSVAFVAPTPPPGWSLTSVDVFCLKNQDPHTDTDYVMSGASSGTSPVSVTGLLHTTQYVCGAVPVWTKPDGSLAYGPTLTQTFTTT